MICRRLYVGEFACMFPLLLLAFFIHRLPCIHLIFSPSHTHSLHQRTAAERVLSMNEENFSLTQLRDHAGISTSVFQDLANWVTARKRHHFTVEPESPVPLSIHTFQLTAGFIVYVCLPLFALTSLYSAIMPFFALAVVPMEELTALHHLLSWTYVSMLCVLICFLPSVRPHAPHQEWDVFLLAPSGCSPVCLNS